jgi:hypothetical protein
MAGVGGAPGFEALQDARTPTTTEAQMMGRRRIMVVASSLLTQHAEGWGSVELVEALRQTGGAPDDRSSLAPRA